MLFNTVVFVIFLIVVFFLYYLLPTKFRWVFLLISSVVFYLIGGIKTVLVPTIIILNTYYMGLMLGKLKAEKRKDLLFRIALFINLGLLVFYKYVNFILTNIFEFFFYLWPFRSTGPIHFQSQFFDQLLLPLGISYMTFQAVGYLCEIKWERQSSERNLAFFAFYLLFFPKLLSGPVVRAYNFLPQIKEEHGFDYKTVVGGLKRILWGFFLKLVISNRLSLYTGSIFSNYDKHNSITLITATIFYTVQLYADFSGYTEIALGSAQVLGYKLMENFDNPFISKSITEFWRRWHISLTKWLFDYLYTPISVKFRTSGKKAIIFAGMSTFLLIGFWHGASWSYIFFGLLHGFMWTFELVTNTMRNKIQRFIPNWINSLCGIVFTFSYVSFSFVFFAADNFRIALNIFSRIFTSRLNTALFTGDIGIFIYSLLGIIIIAINGITDEYYPNFKMIRNKSHIISFSSILMLLLYILAFGVFDNSQFIYFKF